MEKINIKLSKIVPTPKYMYLDVGLIEIFYSLRDLREFNKPVYDKLIHTIDEFLKLYYETYVSKILLYNQQYDVLRDLKKKILNMMHSMIYSIPNTVLVDKLKIGIDGVHLILNYHLNQIKIKNNLDIRDNGMSRLKKEIEPESSILPYGEYDQNYDLF